MKIKKLATITAAILFAGGAAMAQQEAAHVWTDPNGWWSRHFSYSTSDLYTANELNVDAFGTYFAHESKFSHLFQTNLRHNGSWGGGAGVNYFFTQNLGVGGDINMPANGGNFVDSMGGNGIARFPIPATGIAPYIFGGGGRQTQPAWAWYGDAGIGVEFRANPVTGFFADGRYMWGQRSVGNALLLRMGLRFVF